jgi:NADH-quinone oxidoreductase subunit E
MKRYDLRHLKGAFENRMVEILKEEKDPKEVLLFLFEIGDFSPIQRSADVVKENGYELANSLKFNEVDWTIAVKRKD